jgi:hypothetical protein
MRVLEVASLADMQGNPLVIVIAFIYYNVHD